MKSKYLIIIGFFISHIALGQKLLKLDEAQNIALENNWGLKVSEKQIEAFENQVYKGNAGMTPIIDWNTNFGTVFNQVNQQFVDGRNINRFGRAFSPNTNVALNWTLYDGRRMNAVLERLKSQGQQSRVQNNLLIQNTIASVTQAYYDIQRFQQTLNFLKIIIDYYEERLKITEERWQIGRGSKLDFLQSKTDLSTQVANYKNAENQLKTAKIRLNGILARPSETDFNVEENTKIDATYNLRELQDLLKTQNQEYLLLKKSEEINLLNEKEAESFKLPRIALNSSFGYNLNTNNAGFITLNQSVGLNTGISATWRVFDGYQIKRNIQFAKINNEIIKLQKEDLLNRIENELNTAYYQFETDKELLKLELENKDLAEENLEISLEKFKLGASTILELNDAQTRFNTALSRLVNAQFNVRISELELMRISGNLAR
jgi:outer membrane protein